jgi:hypothetical protein
MTHRCPQRPRGRFAAVAVGEPTDDYGSRGVVPGGTVDWYGFAMVVALF